MMRPKTDIDGLWITGHDVGSVGIVGALNSGIMTAMAITKYGIWDLVVAKRNIIEGMLVKRDLATRRPNCLCERDAAQFYLQPALVGAALCKCAPNSNPQPRRLT